MVVDLWLAESLKSYSFYDKGPPISVKSRITRREPRQRARMQGMSGFRRICFITAVLLLIAGATDLMSDLVQAQTCSVPGDECYCCCGHYEVPMPPIVLPEQTAEIYESFQSIPPDSGQRPTLYHP